MAIFLGGFGIVAYVSLAFFMPMEPFPSEIEPIRSALQPQKREGV